MKILSNAEDGGCIKQITRLLDASGYGSRHLQRAERDEFDQLCLRLENFGWEIVDEDTFTVTYSKKGWSYKVWKYIWKHEITRVKK